ncbi:MAG: nucleotidyltransferase family protein [Nitrososphaerota archaeon]|nr:nucleotidyltransferase family protein [Nitrososphaerota archaeon]MDG7019083.1 nucleotidyltransferase family protein [Nitrososphaerota archaeon]
MGTLRAIILSGGLGMRLRPLTDDKPKALIPVNGRPISEYQIEWLVKSGGVDAVTFACGYKWERLKEHFGDRYEGVPVDYSVEDEPLGTGGGIKKALSGKSDDTVVATNGDIITDLPLRRMMEEHRQAGGMPASMLVVPYRSRFGVVKIDKLKMVRDFDEKPAFPDVWINGGVYILSPQKVLKGLPDRGDIERETFPRLVKHGELLSYPYYGDWSYVDSIKDLKELEEALQVQAQGGRL